MSERPDLTPEQLAKPLRVRDLESIMMAVAQGVGPYLAKAVEPLHKRIAELEARPVAKYIGVHEEGREYTEGNFVTYAGGIWHCNSKTTRQRPGSGSSDWTLAVKSGQSR